MPPFSNRWFPLILAIGLVALPGCLRVRQQSVTATFAPDGSRLTLSVTYEGLHVESSSLLPNREQWLKDFAAARETLAQTVATSRRFGVFAGAIDTVDLDPAPDDTPRIAGFKRALAPLLEIRNRAFSLNDRDELCLHQTVTVPNLPALVVVLNEAISTEIRDQVGARLREPSPPPAAGDSLGDESYRRLLRAAESGHAWIKVTHGKVEVDVPILAADARRVVADIERGKPEQGTFSGVQVFAGDDGLHVILGDGKGPSFEVLGPRSRTSGFGFEEELTAFARTLPLPFDASRDPSAVRRRPEATRP